MERRSNDPSDYDYSYTRKHYCNKEMDIEEIKATMKDVKKLLMGNGIVGVAEMARRSFEWMQLKKKSSQGILDWVFRISISILLAFVAVKVGLK